MVSAAWNSSPFDEYESARAANEERKRAASEEQKRMPTLSTLPVVRQLVRNLATRALQGSKQLVKLCTLKELFALALAGPDMLRSISTWLIRMKWPGFVRSDPSNSQLKHHLAVQACTAARRERERQAAQAAPLGFDHPRRAHD